MTLSKIELLTRGAQFVEPKELALRNGLHLEPRCRVCRNDEVREQVNTMLTSGASYASIARAVGNADTNSDRVDKVTVDSVRNHCARHFPVQNIARATYREILERRAKENAVDFVEGVASAITPMAFLETVMAKGYETLLDPDTKVDVTTAMNAATRLQALTDSRGVQRDLLEMKVQVNRIIDAVRSTVPESMWGDIVDKVNEASPVIAVDTDEDVPGDDDLPLDPDDLAYDARSA